MPGPNLFQIRRTSVADREANTTTLPNVGEIGVNLTDGRMWVANSTGVFEIGANTKNSRVSNSFFIGDGSVNTSANSTHIETDTAQLDTAVYVGANVDLTTVGLLVGNTTVNLIANSIIVKLANSTVNTSISVPSTTQYNGSFVLHANGSWVNVAAMDANNAAFLGGTAAAGYQTTAGLSANVATLTANNATWHGTSIFANSTGAYPTSNSVGAVLGNTISRVIITGNSATFTSTLAAGDTTITGFVNATTVVNSAAHTIGTAFIANTIGVYHTGTVNAAFHTTTGFLANSTHVVPTSNSSGQSLGNTISRWVLTANSVTTSGGVSPDSNTLGTALGTTTQRWVLLANTIESTGLANVSALNVVAATNTATLFATTSATVGANVVANTTTILVGNSTVNTVIGNTQIAIGNSTVNALANSIAFTLANSTVTWTLVKPTAAQNTAGNYFLGSNGFWQQVVGGGTPGGANTEIQYNNSGAFGANTNFKFDQATSKFTVGNTTVNATITDAILKLANSTVNTTITIPTGGQYGATNYFLHANGSWVQIVSGGGSVRVYQRFTATGGQTTFTVSGGYTINQIEVFHNGIHLANNEYTQDASTVVLNEAALVGAIIEVAGWISIGTFSPVASGSDTQVQYNDGGSFAGSSGLTFDDATTTLTVGSATVNSTFYSQTANNADFLGGVAAASYVSAAALDAYQTEAGLAANVAILDANNALFLGGAAAADYQTEAGLSANVAILTSNNALFLGGTAAADYQTEAGLAANVAILAANNALFLGGLAAASWANLSSATFTTGVFPTSNAAGTALGDADQRWILTANSVTTSDGVYPASNTLGNALGSATQRWVITANSSTLTGGLVSATVNATTSVNSALVTVGTAFVANTTGAYHTGEMNAASFEVGTSTIVNSSMVSVTAGSLLSANIQINAQTGTTYTLAATDSGKIVTMNNAGAMTVTLPAGLPIGFRTQVLRLGAGTCTLSNTGQTSCNMLSRTGAFAVTAQYGSASIFQTATANTYIVDGLI